VGGLEGEDWRGKDAGARGVEGVRGGGRCSGIGTARENSAA